MDAPDKDLLAPTVKAKPVDIGPEFARLEQITRDLNKAKHPAIAVPEGAVVNRGEYSAPSGADGATTTMTDPIFGSPIPKSTPGDVVRETNAASVISAPLAPQPVANPPAQVATPSLDLRRVFFTGRSGVGKSWLAQQMGAMEFCIQDPITAMLTEQFESIGNTMPMDLLNLILAWGEGAVNDKVPLTATRLLFQQFARNQFGEDFGRTGFWARRLIDNASAVEGQSVITTVTDSGLFTALKEAGFQHFHLMASNATIGNRNRRKNANDQLATHLDNQIIKAISASGAAGEKLKAVWCDTASPPISPRLFDIGSFLALAKQSQSAVVAGE